MKLLQRVLTDLEDVAVQEAVNRMGATLTGCLLSFKREAAAPSRST
jgi:hypothetical protein